jgi:hypothetical protein
VTLNKDNYFELYRFGIESGINLFVKRGDEYFNYAFYLKMDGIPKCDDIIIGAVYSGSYRMDDIHSINCIERMKRYFKQKIENVNG